MTVKRLPVWWTIRSQASVCLADLFFKEVRPLRIFLFLAAFVFLHKDSLELTFAGQASLLPSLLPGANLSGGFVDLKNRLPADFCSRSDLHTP